MCSALGRRARWLDRSALPTFQLFAHRENVLDSTDLRDQLQRTLGDAYVIERELGGGGMSRVFVARERALDRTVVIKVLPDELAGQLSLERFKREIAVAARLQHAHIVPLLTAGETGGLPYFTMPFVEGESLRARLSKGGELPVAEAVRILREVASALAYAHEHGVVHRDIKPENVLLSGGAAMVTDFGVAKAVTASTEGGAGGLTTRGVALGTPAYMSPEQASADPTVDHRADVYAWGVLAYELLSGGTPFGGRPTMAQIAAHVTEAPEDVTKRRPAVPEPLAALVMRALAKRPADRPQSASELMHALDALNTPTHSTPAAARPAAGSGAHSTAGPRARLPLGRIAGGVAIAAVAVTMYLRGGRSGAGAPGESGAVRTMAIVAAPTPEDSTQWFADGIAQTLEGRLLQLPGLEVHSSASLSATRARELPPAEIGKKLHVTSLLRVNVSRNGGDMRASVQLLRTADGRVEWASDPIVAPVRDIFAVQDTIALRTVAALRIQLASSGAARLVSHGTSVVDANDAYMRGELQRRRFDILAAIPLLQRAVALDAKFAQAHSSLALAYVALPITGNAGRDSSLRKSRESADRALALDSTLAGPHLARALQSYIDYRFVDAEREVRHAAELNPADAELREWHGFVLAQLGRLPEALEEERAALRLDPLREDALLMQQIVLYNLHRNDEALAATHALLDVNPQSIFAQANLVEMSAFAGKPDSAVAVTRRVLASAPSQNGSSYALFAFASAEQWAAADSQRTFMLATPTNSPNYIKTMAAVVDGDAEGAARAMEAGIGAREPQFILQLLGCELYFDLLKSNARYLALMKRLDVTPCAPLPRWPIPPRPRGR